MGWVEKNKMFLHHFILGKPDKEMVVDHINGDGMDNRRENLRFVTESQNSQNTVKKKTNKYIGVTPDLKKWRAVCTYNGKNKSLGTYDTQEEAAKAYDRFAYAMDGENALTNKLISYDECKDINPEDLFKSHNRELPKHIWKEKKSDEYFVKIVKSHKVLMEKHGFKTLDSAEKYLSVYLKNEEKKNNEAHMQLAITRNEDGQAIIKAFKADIIVDDKLWHTLSKHTWSMKDTGYMFMRVQGKGKLIHHMVMELNGHDMKKVLDEKKIIDHINSDKLDNRYENLRINTYTGNGHNKSKNKNATSQFHGVTFYKRDKNWAGQITKDGQLYFLGYYPTEEQAAAAFNIASQKLYGDKCKQNQNISPEDYEKAKDILTARNLSFMTAAEA